MQFEFDFDPAFRAVQRPLGIGPGRAWVEVDDGAFTARFGPWCVQTPRANVLAAEVTGPYAFVKVIGGPRLSFADLGLTFATNARRGVCIRFLRPVKGIDPLGTIAHPGLTVTVAEPEALVALLTDQVGRDTERS